MVITIDVKTKGFGLPPKRVKESITKIILQASRLARREMKQLAQSGEFKHPTGRYAGSIQSQIFRDRAEIEPNVIYKWWIEGGAGFPHTPRKLAGSMFKGYHIVERTSKNIEPKVQKLADVILTAAMRAT